MHLCYQTDEGRPASWVVPHEQLLLEPASVHRLGADSLWCQTLYYADGFNPGLRFEADVVGPMSSLATPAAFHETLEIVAVQPIEIHSSTGGSETPIGQGQKVRLIANAKGMAVDLDGERVAEWALPTDGSQPEDVWRRLDGFSLGERLLLCLGTLAAVEPLPLGRRSRLSPLAARR